MQTLRTGSPGGGFSPLPQVVVVTNRSGGALAKGDVVQFDFDKDATETTAIQPGSAEGTSIYNNVVAPVAAEGVDGGAPLGVALEAIADDATGEVMLEGVCQAFVIAASGNVTAGTTKLVPTTAKNLDAVTAAGEAFVARALEDQTTPTTRTLSWVEFHGITPLGFQET